MLKGVKNRSFYVTVQTIALLFFATICWAQNDAPKDSLQQRLQALLSVPELERSQLGLLVYDLTADTVLFSHNARQLMRPASVQKLLTSVTALKCLGGDYRFRTQLYASGYQRDSIWVGDVYIYGGFDPSFGTDDMDAFVGFFAERGVRAIDGHFYCDVSLKDTLKWGAGWCWDDDERTLSPLLYEGRDNFAETFFLRLANAGIASEGVATKRRLPKGLNGIKLYVSRYHTLDQILQRTLKRSDNLYAESIFYQLGAAMTDSFASARQSAAQVESLIKELGLTPTDYNVADGSGLSLYNYTTPQVIVRLLRYAYRDDTLREHLMVALPIAGVDGTLRNRMTSGRASGLVRAKTGSVTGVSTLAGYTTTSAGHDVCFCIMNQGIRSTPWARSFQDKVCQILSE